MHSSLYSNHGPADICDHGSYCLTLRTIGRRPLFGHLEGDSEQATMIPSAVGVQLQQALDSLQLPDDSVVVLNHTLMPDHVHIMVHLYNDVPTGCGLRAVAERLASAMGDEPLLDRFYHAQLLETEGQFLRMSKYLPDNPRRYFIKRQHPEYFTLRRSVEIGGERFDAIGNMALLDEPLVAVRCRSIWPLDETERYAHRVLWAAEQGCTLVGPFISQYEKEIGIQAAIEERSIIRLMTRGLPNDYCPVGKAFYACAEGRLLHLSPFLDPNAIQVLTRTRCERLNQMAVMLVRLSISHHTNSSDALPLEEEEGQ